MADRRSAPRRRLLPSRAVRVSRRGSDATLTGDLLNISPDGLAMRWPDPSPIRIARGEKVRVAFRLGEGDVPFDLEAEVRSVLPAGGEAFGILGLCFCFPGDGGVVRDSLTAVIYADQRERETSGV